MHRTLGTPEIILEIIAHIQSNAHPSTVLPSDVSSALLAFALSSRRFKEFALDALWYHMNNLVPLFKLLRNFSLSSDPEPKGQLQGVIPENDLGRFYAYAKRIRSYRASNFEGVSSSSYIRILHASSRGIILPSLRHLQLTLPSVRDELFFLLHPGLSELSIQCSSPFSSAEGICCPVFINSLALRCPAIKHLRIDAQQVGAAYDEEDALHLCKNIAQMQHLKLLSLTPVFGIRIPSNFLSALQSSQTLSALTITRPICIPSKMKPLHNCGTTLTYLEITLLVGDLPFQDGALLGWNDLPVLKMLRLIFMPTHDLSQIQVGACLSFCTGLRAIAPSLSDLKIMNGKSWQGRVLGFPASSIINLAGPTLTILEIGKGVTPSFQMADIDNLSLLPSLRHFKLYSCQVDPKSLAHFATALPKLSTLGVLMDKLDFPPIDDLPLSNNNVTKLILSVQLTNPVEAASCLNRLFPSLSSFELAPYHPRSDSRSDSWRLLKDVLRALWKVRDDASLRCRRCSGG